MCAEREIEKERGGEIKGKRERNRKKKRTKRKYQSMSVHLCKVFPFQYFFFFLKQQQLEQYFHKAPILYSLWWPYRLSGSPELASFHVFYIDVSGSSQVQQS